MVGWGGGGLLAALTEPNGVEEEVMPAFDIEGCTCSETGGLCCVIGGLSRDDEGEEVSEEDEGEAGDSALDVSFTGALMGEAMTRPVEPRNRYSWWLAIQLGAGQELERPEGIMLILFVICCANFAKPKICWFERTQEERIRIEA